MSASFYIEIERTAYRMVKMQVEAASVEEAESKVAAALLADAESIPDFPVVSDVMGDDAGSWEIGFADPVQSRYAPVDNIDVDQNDS